MVFFGNDVKRKVKIENEEWEMEKDQKSEVRKR